MSTNTKLQGERQSKDALLEEMCALFEGTLKHFTKTPSTLADSVLRAKGHEMVKRVRAELGKSS